MKRSIELWQLLGFAVTAVGGTLRHFLYDWIGEMTWIAVFSSVNESTWEHMKLFFWPAFFFAVVQSFFFGERSNFWCIKLRGILLGLILIPVLFYTYNGVIGKSPDWVNISIFFVTAAVVYICETRLFLSGKKCRISPRTAFILLCAIAVMFAVFTFAAPELNIFRDPLTHTFGI